MLETEAFPGREFPARMERVSPVIGEKGTVKVTIRVQEPDGTLRPGMYVSASIVLDTHENTLLTPKRGVQYDTLGGSPHVFVVRDRTAWKLPVRIGYRNADEVETLPVWVPVVRESKPMMDGVRVLGMPFPVVRVTALGAEDHVIVAGQDKLRGGERVRPVNPVEEAAEEAAAPAAPDAPAPTGTR
jgi:multidrug efflux pump subunit AcrA (membrane-fusion protein)